MIDLTRLVRTIATVALLAWASCPFAERAFAAQEAAGIGGQPRVLSYHRPKTPKATPLTRIKPSESSSAAAVVNAASYLPGVSPGAIATVFGSSLSSVTGVLVADTDPLPTQLLDVSVVVNGVYAPLFSLAYANGEDQVSFQVPYEAPVGVGAVEVQVLNNGVVVADMIADSFTEDPGIFMYQGNYAVAVRYPSYDFIGPNNPASPGDILIVYTTGLGPLTVALIDGYGAPSDPLAYTQEQFQPFVNNEECQVLFSGLAPGFVGLDQINLVLPSDLPPGNLEMEIVTPYSTSGMAIIPVQ